MGGADGGGLAGQVYSELFDDGTPERLQDIFNALETSNEGALRAPGGHLSLAGQALLHMRVADMPAHLPGRKFASAVSLRSLSWLARSTCCALLTSAIVIC